MADISKIDMERINGLLDKLEEVTNKINSMKYVIESGSNDNGWYRKWSDGFIEQWGFRTSNTTNQTINLPTSFSNTSYYVNFIQYRQLQSSAGWNYHYVIRTSVTKSSFQINVADTDGINWYACGY